MAQGKYDDIINLPHHVSKRRAPMPLYDRAAQFSPFAALTGYEAVIEETGRLTDYRTELAESAKAELDEQMGLILENIQTQPEVTLTYFRPDERKLGGAYRTVTGRVKKVDTYERCLLLTDGFAVPMEQIVHIEIN